MPLSNHSVVYGGSFNPPHFGHMVACMWMRHTLNAKEILVVPTLEHAFGKKLADFDHRLAMCNIMCSAINDDVVFTSDVERHLPHPNVTINTIKHFTDKRLALAIGSDLLKSIEAWNNWDELKSMVKIVVIGRKDFTSPIKFDMFSYPIELSSTSSSDIRSMLEAEMDITGLVPHRVKEYITTNNLYKKNNEKK